MCNVGDIHKYIVRKDFEPVVGTGEGLFIITNVKDNSVVMSPIVERSIFDGSEDSISITMFEESGERYLSIITNISLEAKKENLTRKVAEFRDNSLLEIVVKRSRQNKALSDFDVNELSKTASGIVMLDKAGFDDALRHAYDITGNRLACLETEKNIVLDSKEVIMDNPYDTLTVPVMAGSSKVGFFILRFMTEDGEKANVSIENKDTYIIINVLNFDDGLGRFTTRPIHLGNINGKALSINIWSSLNAKKTLRIVKYTLYLEK